MLGHETELPLSSELFKLSDDAVQRSLGSAHVTSILEPVGLDRGDGKRPDGLTIFPWKFGKALVWDVTVVDTLAQSYVATTSQQAGAAADAAENRKQRKYHALENRFIVQPIGFETMGSWGTGAKAFLTEVGTRVKQANRECAVHGVSASACKYRNSAQQRCSSDGDRRELQGMGWPVFIVLE